VVLQEPVGGRVDPGVGQHRPYVVLTSRCDHRTEELRPDATPALGRMHVQLELGQVGAGLAAVEPEERGPDRVAVAVGGEPGDPAAERPVVRIRQGSQCDGQAAKITPPRDHVPRQPRIG
jgi:hypothetical protein